jgi:hypothetical protein
MKRATYLGTTVLVCLAASGLGTGCVVTESTNIKTSGIWAHFTVEHDAHDSIIVRGVLRVGGSTGTIVDLSAGEHLEVNDTSMTEWVEPITNYHWSRVVLSPDPDGLYDIDFVRLDELVSSTILTPDRPTIDSLDPMGVINTDEVLTVYWDDTHPGDDVDVYIDGDCIEDHWYALVADSGMFVSDPVVDLPAPDLPADCTLTVTIARNVVGSVNSAFQGGYTEARTFDELTIAYETLN